VPNFPDPGLSLSGVYSSIGGIEISTTTDMQSPAFQAGQTACAKLLTGGTARPSIDTAQVIAGMRQGSRCMRQHGVTGFRDPTFRESSNPADDSNVSDVGAVILAVPSTINTQSPAFLEAAQACHFS
jgi:hypothetical protein